MCVPSHVCAWAQGGHVCAGVYQQMHSWDGAILVSLAMSMRDK